jgi:hypothetical protein
MKGFFVSGVVGRRDCQCGEFAPIQLPRYTRTSNDWLNVTREYKPRPALPIEKRSETDVIATAEETLQAFVPDSKGKLTQEVLRAFFAPLRISRQQ